MQGRGGKTVKRAIPTPRWWGRKKLREPKEVRVDCIDWAHLRGSNEVGENFCDTRWQSKGKNLPPRKWEEV